MSRVKWQIAVLLISFLCVPSFYSHPTTPNSTNTTPLMQTRKRRGDHTQNILKTEAEESKDKIDRRLNNETTKGIKTKQVELSKIKLVEEKTKDTSSLKHKADLKKRRQIISDSEELIANDPKEEGYLPVCGIDSYEDSIFGCIDVDKVVYDEMEANGSDIKDIIHRSGAMSTDIIWLDEAPEVQKLPEEMELCRGLAKCRMPFGTNSTTLEDISIPEKYISIPEGDISTTEGDISIPERDISIPKEDISISDGDISTDY